MRTFNRRDMMLGAAGAALSLSGINTLAAPPSAEGKDAARKTVAFKGRLAGRSLQQLHDQYRADLYDDFLPFMDKHIIDHELGGFMCNADRDGTLLSTKKNSWYMGRGIWVYSRNPRR